MAIQDPDIVSRAYNRMVKGVGRQNHLGDRWTIYVDDVGAWRWFARPHEIPSSRALTPAALDPALRSHHEPEPRARWGAMVSRSEDEGATAWFASVWRP